jgi:hypothetical protein
MVREVFMQLKTLHRISGRTGVKPAISPDSDCSSLLAKRLRIGAVGRPGATFWLPANRYRAPQLMTQYGRFLDDFFNTAAGWSGLWTRRCGSCRGSRQPSPFIGMGT